MPHHHDCAQIALSATGVVRMTMADGTFIVPPSRALWIPPGVEHAVTVVEDSELLTLYLHQPRGRFGEWDTLCHARFHYPFCASLLLV